MKPSVYKASVSLWHLERLHSEFLKIALSEPQPDLDKGRGKDLDLNRERGQEQAEQGQERLSRIAETLLFEYYNMLEKALDCFGLSIEKIREKIMKREMPKFHLKVRAEELFSERMIEKLRESIESEEGEEGKGKGREGTNENYEDLKLN